MPPGSALFGLMGGTPKTRPLNTWPLWQYLLIALVLVMAGIYAAPNLYPSDYAVQVTPANPDMPLDDRYVKLAADALTEAGIKWRGPEISGRTALFRLEDSDSQLHAHAVLRRAFADVPLAEHLLVAMNLAPTTPAWLEALGAKSMNYGLDLSGGVHFLLQVDLDATIAKHLEATMDGARRTLRENPATRYNGRPEIVDGEVRFSFLDASNRDAAIEVLRDQYPEVEVDAIPDSRPPALRMRLTETAIAELEQNAVEQNIQSLRNRVDELGVSEPLVQRLGRNRIVVDLPGVQDSTRAKSIIGKVANLEFRLVARPDAPSFDVERFEYEGREVELERSIIVTGDCVTNARQGYDPQTQEPQVSITLDGACGERMHRITRTNVGNSMAIVFQETKTRSTYEVVDGKEVEVQVPYETERVISVATIRDALGNRFRITGLAVGEARDLALLLRAGALAAPMQFVEERTVGATLGEANVERGALSMVSGFVAVMIFMVVYYRVFGIAANMALVANLVLMIAIMSVLGATLTLPGIAGIVLTVGMAVDANVLIFSRIREELRNRSPQQAIHAGFERAVVTIMDANITTLFVGIILYAVGTGPVRGFAVTLTVGILTSMFTAIIGTRALINLIYGGRTVKRLSIGGPAPAREAAA